MSQVLNLGNADNSNASATCEDYAEIKCVKSLAGRQAEPRGAAGPAAPAEPQAPGPPLAGELECAPGRLAGLPQGAGREVEAGQDRGRGKRCTWVCFPHYFTFLPTS